MLTNTGIVVNADKVLECLPELDVDKHELSIPTGDFFYDPWVLKDEYKETELEILFNKLETPGQVRVNVIAEGTAYQQHADIDDRYHLALDGIESYLVDLTEQKLYPTIKDNNVYLMDTSRLHSAVNFGYYPRKQVVIRKLLKRNKLKDPVSIKLVATPVPRLRYNFDQTVSVWLNKANKQGIITNFAHKELEVSLDIEGSEIAHLEKVIDDLPIQIK